MRVAGETATTCPTMTAGSNVYIGYLGAQSGCTPGSGNCSASENISFNAATFGYSYSCAPHTFSWNFGDGSTSTDQSPAHAYTTGGDYTVTLKVKNSAQEVTHTRTIKVVGTNNCPTMVANQNVFMQYLGTKSKCTASGGICQNDEQIAFGANALGYNFGCSAHTFTWTFGDGSSSNEQAPTHVYENKGTFNGTLVIENSKQKLVIPFTIITSSGSSRRRSAGH